jgi:hypothetical protein
MFLKRSNRIQFNCSNHVVRSILTIVITLSLFTASVPVSTYAALQAPLENSSLYTGVQPDTPGSPCDRLKV